MVRKNVLMCAAGWKISALTFPYNKWPEDRFQDFTRRRQIDELPDESTFSAIKLTRDQVVDDSFQSFFLGRRQQQILWKAGILLLSRHSDIFQKMRQYQHSLAVITLIDQ